MATKPHFSEEVVKENMQETNFAERLNIALDKEGFPPKHRGRIQLLAEMVGLTHRGASKWINGESCPPAKKYADLARKLNVREEWLRTGHGSMTDEKTGSSGGQQISLVSSVQIYSVENFLSPTRVASQVIHCNLSNKGSLFGIQLETEAMSPRFPSGSIVIFDNEKHFKDGDFVLANFDSYPTPIFRQLLLSGSTIYLHAHNPKFDRLLLSDPSKILGVMIQAILSFI